MLKSYMSYEQFSSLFISTKGIFSYISGYFCLCPSHLHHNTELFQLIPPMMSRVLLVLSDFWGKLLSYVMGYDGKQSLKLFIGLSLSLKLMAPICTPDGRLIFSFLERGWLLNWYLLWLSINIISTSWFIMLSKSYTVSHLILTTTLRK